ncbi:hypothetical protein B4U79_18123 [Dinothrombium tinctorium]|uniref:Endonuclease/exonuclease/phosphatase domain-containing protein n=1 Tax=Dinothrombium tinctorium TaxID=1965070 RepID=A0A443R2A4_9ACAR|nr:hypothetical protein B4U79_18123 [Dinothrombium tinctorium]
MKMMSLFNNVKPDLLCLTETWLKPEYPDDLLSIDGYFMLRNDRKFKKGGGIAVYVKNEFNGIVNEQQLNFNFEHIKVGIKFKNNKEFYVTTIYLPPDLKKEIRNEYFEFLKTLNDENILIGDFNIDLLGDKNRKWLNQHKNEGPRLFKCLEKYKRKWSYRRKYQ